MNTKAVIFDLDGVIVSTDEYHYHAWKYIADKEDINFDRDINNKLRGVSRAESLEIILANSTKCYSDDEKSTLLDIKNSMYKELLNNLSDKDILSDVREVINKLKEMGIKIAIGSSSKNTMKILEKIGMTNDFDTIVDGTMIKKSKPDPEVFLLAAEKLCIDPKYCIVVEDAKAGVEAGISAKMRVCAVGDATNYKIATYNLNKLGELINCL